MADFGFSFDANDVEPSTPFVALPPGDYHMQIIAAAMEPTSAGTGRFLKLELEVTDGEHAGRKTYDRLNLDNPNQQAVDIARRTLSAICHAVGHTTVISSSEPLHFKKMIVKVATVPRKDKQGNVVQGEFSNEIKGYKPLSGGAPAGTARTATSSPPAAKGGFTPNNAGGSVASTAPWKKQG